MLHYHESAATWIERAREKSKAYPIAHHTPRLVFAHAQPSLGAAYVFHQSSDILSETHDTYLGELRAATDDDLLSLPCDEVLLVALIRQVKSDRPHAP